MRTENKVPAVFSMSRDDARFEDGVQADVYHRHERPVAIVLWRGSEPQPYAAFKDSDDGRLVRFAVTANDDVPKHDRRETHLNVRVQVHADARNDAARVVALYRGDESQPLLVVTGTGSPMRLHPFNERAKGIFANDFRDIDGLPVADVFGASVRAVLHGRDARAWSVPQTAKLVAEYSSDQMARLIEVVNVRSRDDAWRFRYQDHGLAGSEELAYILSSRWPQVHLNSEQLPLVRVDVAPNTYSFYVSNEEGGKKVRVHQFTDFRGSMLEADFPMGSSTEWRVPMPETTPDMDVVNAAGRSLFKDWATRPKTFPAAEAPPYDPSDMDAAMAYTRRTRALFASGDHDQAYALYMRDPNGGANRAFSQTTKEQFVVGMYSGRDAHGRPVHPQPEGYQQGGFTVGHQAHLRHDNSWAKIAHLFEFDGKPYVMLEFDQPVSTFTDDEGRLKVVRGVASAEMPAFRDTRVLVAADEIDGSRPAAAAERLAQADLREPPQDDDEFDAYMANEHFQKIQRVEVMEGFLLRAARRYHVLDAEQATASKADKDLLPVKQKAWEFLYDQFSNSMSDLRMFFSETDDYHGQSREERKRLNAVADALVGSAKDVTKIDQAERLGKLAMPTLQEAITEAHRAAALTLIDEKIAAGQRERETASYDTQNAIGVAYSLLHQIRGAILEGRPQIDIRSYSDGSLDPAAECYDSAHARHLSALSHLSSFIDCLDELEIIDVAREYREEMPSVEQRAAVAAFCDANGSDWKEKLSALWMSGNYSRRGIDTDQAALLQQVRNEFGPEWLSNVQRTDLGVECDDADLRM